MASAGAPEDIGALLGQPEWTMPLPAFPGSHS